MSSTVIKTPGDDTYLTMPKRLAERHTGKSTAALRLLVAGGALDISPYYPGYQPNTRPVEIGLRIGLNAMDQIVAAWPTLREGHQAAPVKTLRVTATLEPANGKDDREPMSFDFGAVVASEVDTIFHTLTVVAKMLRCTLSLEARNADDEVTTYMWGDEPDDWAEPPTVGAEVI